MKQLFHLRLLDQYEMVTANSHPIRAHAIILTHLVRGQYTENISPRSWQYGASAVRFVQKYKEPICSVWSLASLMNKRFTTWLKMFRKNPDITDWKDTDNVFLCQKQRRTRELEEREKQFVRGNPILLGNGYKPQHPWVHPRNSSESFQAFFPFPANMVLPWDDQERDSHRLVIRIRYNKVRRS